MRKREFKKQELENMSFLYQVKKKSTDYIGSIYNCCGWLINKKLRKMKKGDLKSDIHSKP